MQIRRAQNALVPFWIGVLLWLALAPAQAILPRQQRQLPDFDKRTPVPQKELTERRRLALQKLSESLESAQVDWDSVLGTPHWVRSSQGFLTGKNGEGKAVSKAAAEALDRTDPDRGLKAFLNEHRALFGHDASALTSARKTREFVTAHNGMRTVIWQQEFENIPVFEGLLISHSTRDGELVSISSHFLSELPTAVQRGMPNRNPAQLIKAESAVIFAAAVLEQPTALAEIKALKGENDPGGEDKRFSVPGFKGETRVQKVWLPIDPQTLRLCWEVVLASRKEAETFRLLIDAETGQAWVRQCLTHYISPATYRVYTSDSPSPFSPAHPTPSSVQPPLTQRTLVVTNAVSVNASPAGWINDGGNETRGNNVDAHLDRNDDDLPDLPRPQGNPPRVFDFPLDLTQAPSASGNASVVQLFFWCNWMHDKLYELGFTEAAGNFQGTNFGRGGIGSDPVQADAQDGGDVNNANMTTFPDGTSPRLQIYLFDGPTPDRDGTLDAEVVLHEYTHGLTTRRVGGGVGITASQSLGLGEGWSDYYALSLLSEPGDNVDGNYPLGGYLTYLLSGMNQNYYFGIRRYPYATDLSKNPLTFKDIDPSLATGHPGVPVSPVFGGIAASEVHGQGEVWCSALWECRANLIRKLGSAAGNQLMLQLVTDALNLTPANPNFIQARDAILQADRIAYAGTNQNELWMGFAKRGLGFSASCPPSTTTLGVQESFDLPDDLVITPALPFVSSGPGGGPFIPSSFTYSLSNRSTNPVVWLVFNTNSWLTITNSSGTLGVGSPTVSLTAFINNSAPGLSDGIYSGFLVFTNLISGRSQVKQVTLSVGQADYFTELFDLNDNDVRNQMLTFVPNGSGSFYAACREPATNFPVDPRLGKKVTLKDDSYAQIVMAGSSKVSFYGKETNVFFIGSNGYITFDSGDSAYSGTLAAHFGLRRISGLFADLNPEAGGSISWQQLGDRVAVTFENVPEYKSGTQNSFQIELFYDGRIRLTHLNIGAGSALIGLSRGGGVPPALLESDLTSYPPCSLPLTISVPASVQEGMGLLQAVGTITLPGPASSNVTVSFRSSDPSEIQVPPSLVIPSGQTQGHFDIQVIDDGELDGTQVSVITASASGYFSGTASIAVADNETASLSLSLPPQVSEGDTSFIATLNVSAAPATLVQVNLSCSDLQRLQVPSSVVVPAGVTSVPFTVSVLDNNIIDGNKQVQITAQVPGWTAGIGSVLVLDNETNALFLVAPSQTSEAAGIVNAKVVLSGTVATNQIVFLDSSIPGQLEVPASLIIPAGRREFPFQMLVIDNTSVDGNRNVTFSVHAPGWFGAQATMVILDDDTPPEPFRPFPPDLSSNMPVATRLSWKSGDGELMINGDFELGTFEGWTRENTGTGEFIINNGNVDPESPDGPLPPASGNFSALSNPSGAGRHLLYQDLFIPPSASTVTLRWDQRIRNHGSAFGSNQQFRVEVRTLSNDVLRVAYRSNPGEPLLGEWTSRAYDLSDFRGTSVRIAFVEEDSTAFLNAHVDNVSVLAQSSAALSYEVYLGTSAETGGDLIGTTTDTFWDVPELAPFTTYYWHVISRGIGETSGPTWSFTTRGVDHFSWDSIQSTQRLGQAFSVRISARDESGAIITNFQGSVTLSGWALDPGGSVLAQVNVNPTVLTGFINGRWSGSVTILEPSPRLLLTVSDDQNHFGESSILSVVEPNDLSVSVVASANPVITGTEIIFSAACYNAGPLPATGVSLRARLPATASLSGLDISQGACTVSGQDVVCDVGDLAGDSCAVLTLFMNPGPEGTIITTVEASRQEDDANSANNSVSLTTEVIPIRFVSVTGMSASEEDGEIQFTLHLDAELNLPISVDFNTIDGTAIAGLDYVATNGTVVIPPGSTTAVVPLRILHDFRNEPTESFYLAIGNVTNALTDIDYAEGIILDNDPQPTLFVLDGITRAPVSGTTNLLFPVVLSSPSGYEVTADFTTSDGTALAGPDYSPTNGTITFPPGVTNLSVNVGVSSSFPDPTNRLFHLNFSNPNRAILSRAMADGVIVGRNHLPKVSIANTTVTEGASGKTDASFLVSLSFASTTNVFVAYQTQPGTATPGVDYDSAAGTLVFLPGQESKTITVPVRGDSLDEEDETFSVILSGITNATAGITNATCTILNDDPHPSLVFGNATVNSLLLMDTEVTLPVRLDAASGRIVTVAFQTRDGSAVSGIDYGSTNGTLQFPPGVTNALLRLRILKDHAHEPEEVFFVDFSSPLNAFLNTAAAVITITHASGGIGALDHFQWGTIPSPQFSNSPMTVTVSARDAQNQIIQDFNSPVALTASIPEAPLEAGSGTIPAVFPLGSFYQDARSQILYPASELGASKRFSALALQLASSPAQTLSNCVIRLKQTSSLSNLSWQTTGWQIVFQGTADLNGNGWVTFPFFESFWYDGTNHLLLDFSFDNDEPGVDAQCFARETYQPRSFFYRSDKTNGNPLNWTGSIPPGFSSSLVPNLRLIPAPVSLPLFPSAITQWNAGSYTGSIVISALGTNVQILAEAEDGHSGRSNPFDVKENPPLITLTSPAPGSTFPSGLPINFSASLSSASGIQRVEFFSDNIKLAEVTQAPFTFTWINPSVGSHLLQAVAYASSGLTATSAVVGILVQSGNYSIYKPPAGSWAYLYDGSATQGGVKGKPVLDGTWDHNNPSSEWDGLGRGAGFGSPGGISSDGNILTLEDAVGSASGPGDNRSLFFTHALKDVGVTNANRILDNGITLTFRARLTPNTVTPAPEIALPNGYGIFNSGRGNFGIRQAGQPGLAGAGLISFSLVQAAEASSNSNAIIFPGAGLTMNRLNGDTATNDVDSASRTRLNFLWNLPPGSRPYLTSGNSERNIAYNPITGHLLLLSRAAAVGGLQIPILNASNGTEVGKLSTNGVTGGSSVLNGIGVADDGAIYAANVVNFNNSSNSAFRIYRWAYESAVPTVAFSGEILNGQRWGDTLDVRGSGPDTQLLVGSGSGTNQAAIFVTANGITFIPVLLDSPGGVNNGDFRTTLAFGPNGSFFARQLNGPLLQMGFDLSTHAATLLRAFGNGAFPASISSISLDTNLHLLAGVTPALAATNAASLEVFDLDSLATNLVNQSMDRLNFSAANANPSAISSVRIGGGKVFALDSNNGLLACDLISLPGTSNLLPLDPTIFHEFWITIQGSTGVPGNGTHTVSIYADGSTNASVFHVTAGTGVDLSSTSAASTNFTTAQATNYLGLGCPSTSATGAIDVDYFGYKPGVFIPTVANAAPVLAPIADRNIHAGTTLVITNSATDPDTVNGPLAFSLDAAPPGAVIGSGTGIFSWTAPDFQVPGTNLVTIRVTDFGSPPRSDTQSFQVVVVARPKANAMRFQGGITQLSWSSIPGQRYRVLFKNDLNEPDWQILPGDVLASGVTASKSDSTGTGGQRFYRIQILP